MKIGKLSYVVGAVALSAVMPAAFAQSMADAAATSASQTLTVPRGIAAPSFQVPFAGGAGWGNIGVGMYGQTLDDKIYNDNYDGAAGINIGLGDPAKYVGLDVAASFSSLSKADGSSDGFGEAGSIGLKLHTNLPGYTSFAVGVESIGRWGAAKDANTSSVYAAASKYFPIATQGLVATIGIGDGAFHDQPSGAGVFGSLAYYPMSWLSVIGEYTGRFANAAVSVSPIQSLPLTITLGAVNLGDRYNLGTQFAGSVGYGFSF